MKSARFIFYKRTVYRTIRSQAIKKLNMKKKKPIYKVNYCVNAFIALLYYEFEHDLISGQLGQIFFHKFDI